MRLVTRLLLSAALITALGPMPVALAENGSGPSFSFDTADDMTALRGTDRGAPVEIATPAPSADVVPSDATSTLDTPIGKATRVQGVQPTIGDEEDASKIRSRTAEALDASEYDPIGIRLGSFLLLPAVELRTGYTSNAAGSATGGPSGLFTIAPDILLKSQWSQNEAAFRLKGAYEYFTDQTVAPKPNLYVEGNGRIDLPRDWKLRLKADYNYDTEDVNSLDFVGNKDNPPGVNTFDGGATLDGNFGRVIFQLRGTATYTGYEAATFDSTTLSQTYRNNTLVSGAARVGYQVTPTIAPFVETQLYSRIFDQAITAAGYSRNSNAITLRGGLVYTASPVLRGEVALGWRHDAYTDSTNADFDTPTVDASLIWSPSPLTQVALTAATFVDPANDPSASGTVVYDVGLAVERYVRRNLTLEGDLGYRHEHYVGTELNDVTYEAGISATYKFNREAWLVGRLSQEYYASAVPGGDYPTTTATIGLRIQR